MSALSLIDRLREVLEDQRPGSFQLMGEDLWRVSGIELVAAAERWRDELERVPEHLRDSVQHELQRFQQESHGWMLRYNQSLHRRVRGYVELGRLCGFEYPWPVVAILGVCQVLSGVHRTWIYGLLGRFLRLELLDRLTDDTLDVLRRTNRAIFADSVPVVLLALRAHRLRASGQEELAAALIGGPLPLLMDQESRDLASRLYQNLAIEDGGLRFEALSALTLRHFGREQKIFTHNLGGHQAASRKPTGLMRRLVQLGSVPAPIVERTLLGRRVQFRDFNLPAGFDIRDHDARVASFGAAFVRSVTGSLADYQCGVDYVVKRFGRPKERFVVGYPRGGFESNSE